MSWITPGPVDGAVDAPPSKSAAIRAVAAAAMATTPSSIAALPACDDVEAAIGAAEALGAGVARQGGRLEIRPGAGARAARIDCRESGLCLRLFAPIAALDGATTVLAATGTLATRPVDMLPPALRQLGAACEATGGRPPVAVRGPLRGGAARVLGGTTSQLLSGLLTALPLAANDSAIEVDVLRSGGYVALTLSVLRAFGVEIEAEPGGRRFRVPGRQRPVGAAFAAEGDWSGAAALLVAGAVAGRVTVRGLDPDSLQPDRRVLEALLAAGAEVDAAPAGITVRHRRLDAFAFDGSDCPDLLPPLAALAASCRGVSVLRGAGRLAHKESDRAETLLAALRGLGREARRVGDALEIRGGPIRGGEVSAFGDHRIAMAAAVLGLGAAAPVRIRGASCVAKSYPRFFADLARLQGGAP